MGGIFGKMFDTRTKEDKQRDFESYTNLIFPYGEVQKEKVFDVLDILYPKSNKKYLRMHYIIVKEGMVGEDKITFSEASQKIKKKTLIKLKHKENLQIEELLKFDIHNTDELLSKTKEQIVEYINKKISA